MLAALGGVNVAQAVIGLAQYAYGKEKVVLCHKQKKTIRVGKPAVAAHLRHGDQVGTCAQVAAKQKAAKEKAAAKKAAAAAKKAAKKAAAAAKKAGKKQTAAAKKAEKQAGNGKSSGGGKGNGKK